MMNDSGQGKSAGTVSEGRLVILGVLAKSAGPGPARLVVRPGGVAGEMETGWNTLRQVENEFKLEGGRAQPRGSWGLTVNVGRKWR